MSAAAVIAAAVAVVAAMLLSEAATGGRRVGVARATAVTAAVGLSITAGALFGFRVTRGAWPAGNPLWFIITTAGIAVLMLVITRR